MASGYNRSDSVLRTDTIPYSSHTQEHGKQERRRAASVKPQGSHKRPESQASPGRRSQSQVAIAQANFAKKPQVNPAQTTSQENHAQKSLQSRTGRQSTGPSLPFHPGLTKEEDTSHLESKKGKKPRVIQAKVCDEAIDNVENALAKPSTICVSQQPKARGLSVPRCLALLTKADGARDISTSGAPRTALTPSNLTYRSTDIRTAWATPSSTEPSTKDRASATSPNTTHKGTSHKSAKPRTALATPPGPPRKSTKDRASSPPHNSTHKRTTQRLPSPSHKSAKPLTDLATPPSYPCKSNKDRASSSPPSSTQKSTKQRLPSTSHEGAKPRTAWATPPSSPSRTTRRSTKPRTASTPPSSEHEDNKAEKRNALSPASNYSDVSVKSGHWSSEVDEVIERMVKEKKPYKRRVPPAKNDSDWKRPETESDSDTSSDKLGADLNYAGYSKYMQAIYSPKEDGSSIESSDSENGLNENDSDMNARKAWAPVYPDKNERITSDPDINNRNVRRAPAPDAIDRNVGGTRAPGFHDRNERVAPAPDFHDRSRRGTPAPDIIDRIVGGIRAPVFHDQNERRTPAPGFHDGDVRGTPAPIASHGQKERGKPAPVVDGQNERGKSPLGVFHDQIKGETPAPVFQEQNESEKEVPAPDIEEEIGDFVASSQSSISDPRTPYGSQYEIYLADDYDELEGISLSYDEPCYPQKGLGSYLEAEGELDGMTKEDFRLDLSWLQEQNPTPRRKSTYDIRQEGRQRTQTKTLYQVMRAIEEDTRIRDQVLANLKRQEEELFERRERLRLEEIRDMEENKRKEGRVRKFFRRLRCVVTCCVRRQGDD